MEGLPQANDDEISRLRRKIEERRRDLKELEQQLQALTQAEEVKEPKPKKAKLEPAIAVDAAAASQAAAAGPSSSGNVPALEATTTMATPMVQTSSLTLAPSTSPFVQGSHPGISCDRSGMMPIVGMRYHLRGHNYDLCQAEYDKLSEFEKCQYEALAPN